MATTSVKEEIQKLIEEGKSSQIISRGNSDNQQISTIREKFRSAKELLAAFNPSKQNLYCSDRYFNRCFTGTAPTLKQLSEAFGESTAETWIQIQLFDLSEFSGAAKPSVQQYEEMARMILSEAWNLKLTEMIVFFRNFKIGKYGRFFGSVDGIKIMESLADFKIERREIIAKIHKEEEHAERERLRIGSGAITYREWINMKNNEQKR